MILIFTSLNELPFDLTINELNIKQSLFTHVPVA